MTTPKTLSADDVARVYRERTGRPIKPQQVQRLARASQLPVFDHDRHGRCLFSERAVTALITRDTIARTE
jgi:hypothetical protein